MLPFAGVSKCEVMSRTKDRSQPTPGYRASADQNLVGSEVGVPDLNDVGQERKPARTHAGWYVGAGDKLGKMMGLRVSEDPRGPLSNQQDDRQNESTPGRGAARRRVGRWPV